MSTKINERKIVKKITKVNHHSIAS